MLEFAFFIATAYSYIMVNKDKLLEKAKRNPKGLSFAEFETLLKQCGWILERQRGSHKLWYSPARARLPIQPRGNMAKAYQVLQFIERYEEESRDGT